MKTKICLIYIYLTILEYTVSAILGKQPPKDYKLSIRQRTRMETKSSGVATARSLWIMLRQEEICAHIKISQRQEDDNLSKD